jgi:hypothetical protein
LPEGFTLLEILGLVTTRVSNGRSEKGESGEELDDLHDSDILESE